jgi:hypothetical protein
VTLWHLSRALHTAQEWTSDGRRMHTDVLGILRDGLVLSSMSPIYKENAKVYCFLHYFCLSYLLNNNGDYV